MSLAPRSPPWTSSATSCAGSATWTAASTASSSAAALPGSPLRASLRAAARVGLVGGVVFGLSAAIAAAGLDPRLLREPQDLLVLAAYLVLAFAAFTGALALAAGLLAGWAGRAGHHPGPSLARNAGLAVALLAIAFVALWWRSHLAGASVVAQAAGLAVGLLLSLALGRFASLAAVAVLSAGGASGRLPPASLSRRRALPLLAGALAVFAAVFGAAALLPGEKRPETPDFAVVPTGLRVRIAGRRRARARHGGADDGARRDARAGRARRRGRARGAAGGAGARAGHRVDHDRDRPRAGGPRHPVAPSRAASPACARRWASTASAARSPPRSARRPTCCGSRARSRRAPRCAA